MRKLGFILSIFALPLHTGSKCIISKVHPTTLSISHGIDRYVFATLEDKRNVQKSQNEENVRKREDLLAILMSHFFYKI